MGLVARTSSLPGRPWLWNSNASWSVKVGRLLLDFFAISTRYPAAQDAGTTTLAERPRAVQGSRRWGAEPPITAAPLAVAPLRQNLAMVGRFDNAPIEPAGSAR